ncbi:hypothetical protein [Segnochrobactrum spirostomi]|uniref:hypothetical protein n=1 Tax=Segnochrobactrum spirostomi TaxID=2608987 RepID=UPI001FE9173E|nr:hypothetical protein [Segnochrobactrum spirostomi]
MLEGEIGHEIGRPVGAGDSRPGGGEGGDQSPPDATAGAGDQHGAAVEPEGQGEAIVIGRDLGTGSIRGAKRPSRNHKQKGHSEKKQHEICL